MKKRIAALLAASGAVLVISATAVQVEAVTPHTFENTRLTGGSSAAATTRQRNVRVVDNGVTRVYNTRTTNIADFLQEHGYVLEEGDRINQPLETRFIDNYIPRVVITRGMDIVVMLDGVPQYKRVASDARVGNVIALVEAAHGEVFMYNPRRSQPVEQGQILEFHRAASHTFTSNFEVPYEVVYNYDSTINRGEEVVVQEGEVGVSEVVSEIIMLGGIRIDSRMLSRTLLAEPVDQIISIGTRDPITVRPRFEIPTAAGDFTFGRRLVMNATAYTAGFESTGKRPGDPGYGITASGMRVQHGVVAVDPRVIPLGTPLFIEGYGFAVAADTGSAIRGYSIDLFMYNVQDALNFGRRQVTVFILE